MWPEVISWSGISHALTGWFDVKTVVPIVISFVALFFSFINLFFTLKDRRPRLLLRPRKATVYHTYKLHPTADGGVAFVGGVEVYNLSGRPNAIRGYEFWRKKDDGEWLAMESQNYNETSEEGYLERNKTPVTLAPYSGIEVRVLAFMPKPQPFELPIRIEVEDLFGKRYNIEVTAFS